MAFPPPSPRPPQCCPCWTRRAQRPPLRQSPPVCPPAPAGGILMASGAPTLAPVVLRRRHLSRNTPWAWVWSPGPCPWTHKARDSAPRNPRCTPQKGFCPPCRTRLGVGELDTGLAQAWRPVPRRGGEEDRAAAVGRREAAVWVGTRGRHPRSAHTQPAGRAGPPGQEVASLGGSPRQRILCSPSRHPQRVLQTQPPAAGG